MVEYALIIVVIAVLVIIVLTSLGRNQQNTFSNVTSCLTRAANSLAC